MKAIRLTRKVVQSRRPLPRSLRLRLILWYGSLIAVALGFFALLFLLLTTDAIDTSVNSAVHTEARVAMHDVLDDLAASPPYWSGPTDDARRRRLPRPWRRGRGPGRSWPGALSLDKRHT